MKNTILQLTLSFIFVLTPVFTFAATYNVTPRIIDLEVKQRDIFSQTITITNNLSHKVNIYASVNEVSLNEGGDITEFVPPSMSDNTQTVTSWIQITRGRIEVAPGQTKEIPISFKIHPEAEPGVYHALIGFGSGRNRPESEAQVQNNQAPSVIVTLSVDQEKSEFLKLSKFIIERFVTKSDNKAITYTLSNPGTADVVPTGEIIISNGRGEEVAAVQVNPNNDSLAPGQETTYSTPAPIDGLMGKYKAFLSVDYGSTQLASVYDTAFFYVLPWQKLLIIFIVVLIIAIVATLFVSRRMSDDEYDEDHEHDELPLHIRTTTSEEKEHDINLKK